MNKLEPKAEGFLGGDPYDIEFDSEPLFYALQDMATRIINLEAEVKWLRNPIIG